EIFYDFIKHENPDYKVLLIMPALSIDEYKNLDDYDVEFFENYEDLDQKMKPKDPFICLVPDREDAWKPESGFQEPINLFKSSIYGGLELGYKKAIVLQKVGDLMRNTNFICKHRIDYRKRNPVPEIDQACAYWDAFTVEYDTDYYGAFLCISFSGYITYA
ncbi:MAG: hypothetical protein ACYC40_01700, partial [Patescibacteria group bacterium]